MPGVPVDFLEELPALSEAEVRNLVAAAAPKCAEMYTQDESVWDIEERWAFIDRVRVRARAVAALGLW